MTGTDHARRRRPETVTRVHAAAIMTGRHDILVLDRDGRIRPACASAYDLAQSADTMPIVLYRHELLDAGVEFRHGRFTPGSGPLVDQVLAEVNAELAAYLVDCGAGAARRACRAG